MKNGLKQIWELIKLGAMLLGTLVVIHATILLIHNATNEPTPPPGGWYPPKHGEEGYKEYLQKLENKKRLNGVDGLE